MQEQPTTNKKWSNSNQAALDSSDPVATSNTMSDGVNTSQKTTASAQQDDVVEIGVAVRDDEFIEFAYDPNSNLEPHAYSDVNGWVNEKLLSGLVSAAADDYFKDLYLTSSELSNLDYNTRRLTELGTKVFGTNELNSALLGLGKLKSDTIKGYGSTLASYQSLTPGNRGQYMERIYNTPSAIFDYSLDTTQFTQGI